MKKTLNIFSSAAFAIFLTGASYLPAIAQNEDLAGPAAGHSQPGAEKRPAAATERKPAAKKKVLKKKKAAPPEPASEYKFQAQDTPLTYTFDKKGDPIVKKQGKAGKSSKKSGGIIGVEAKQETGQPLPKLKNAAPVAKAARYVCPMGEYEGDKPGTCPKCGMTLMEKK